MIYLSEEMREKLDACRRWKVRVIDCRFRPLDSTSDNYKPNAKKPGRSPNIISIKAGQIGKCALSDVPCEDRILL